MKLELTEKKPNKLLHRTEIRGTVTFDGATPSRKDVREQVAAALKVDAGLVVSKEIYAPYGAYNATILAYAYDNADALNRIETKKWRKQVEAPKTEEAPAAQGA